MAKDYDDFDENSDQHQQNLESSEQKPEHHDAPGENTGSSEKISDPEKHLESEEVAPDPLDNSDHSEDPANWTINKHPIFEGEISKLETHLDQVSGASSRFKDYVQDPSRETNWDEHRGHQDDLVKSGFYDYGHSSALQQLYTDPELERQAAEFEAFLHSPVVFPDDHETHPDESAAVLPEAREAETRIAQGDAQNLSRADSKENVNQHKYLLEHHVQHVPKIQHDDHPTHRANHGESSKPPTPALEAVGDGSAILSEGHEGDAVGAVQSLLGLEADGVFSAELAAQIAHFQESEGIEPTGKVDQLTLQALQEAEYDRLHPKKAIVKDGKFNLRVAEDHPLPPTQSTHDLLKEQSNPVAEAAESLKQLAEGVVIGYGEANQVIPLDAEHEEDLSRLRNDVPFAVGEVIGEVGGLLQGIGEMISGGGMMGGGAVEAGTGVLAVPGATTVVAGAALAGHGAVVAGTALNNLAEDLPNLFNPIDGGDSAKSEKLSAGTQEAKAKGWDDAPEGYEWYKRKDGDLDVRRKPEKQHLPERQYNPETREFKIRDKTPDFAANRIGDELVVDVSNPEAYTEPLNKRSTAMARRDGILAGRDPKTLTEEEKLRVKVENQIIQDSSEEIGEIGLRSYFAEHYPNYERIDPPNSGKAKQGRFDSIYKDPGPPPTYIVGEGKGGDSPLGQRQVGENVRLNAQQCTPQYNKSIIEEMERRGDPMADELREALEEGQLRSFKVQTPIDNLNGKAPHTIAPDLQVQKLKVSEYDMKESIRVDKVAKPTNLQVPRP